MIWLQLFLVSDCYYSMDLVAIGCGYIFLSVLVWSAIFVNRCMFALGVTFSLYVLPVSQQIAVACYSVLDLWWGQGGTWFSWSSLCLRQTLNLRGRTFSAHLYLPTWDSKMLSGIFRRIGHKTVSSSFPVVSSLPFEVLQSIGSVSIFSSMPSGR